jgi:hypothetical protein
MFTPAAPIRSCATCHKLTYFRFPHVSEGRAAQRERHTTREPRPSAKASLRPMRTTDVRPRHEASPTRREPCPGERTIDHTRLPLDSRCGWRRRPQNGPVAQRLEQGTHNPLVPGSNPGGPTTAAESRQIDRSTLGSGDAVRPADRPIPPRGSVRLWTNSLGRAYPPSCDLLVHPVRTIYRLAALGFCEELVPVYARLAVVASGDPKLLNVARSGKWAVFEVIDRGIGIPAADRDPLFQMFHRGKMSGRSAEPGSVR